MPDEDVPEYQNWPASQEEREAMARDVFGKYLVYSYDSGVGLASKMLFEGYRYPTVTVQQERYFEWISRLSDEDRKNALTFVQEISSGVVFSILNKIDGTSGRLVGGNNAKTGFDYCNYSDSLNIQLDIIETTYEHGAEDKLVETIPVSKQPEGGQAVLHELWFEWLKKYSLDSSRHKRGAGC